MLEEAQTETEKTILELAFSFEKETKNAVRYTELYPVDAEAKVGKLYVRKAALASIGRWSLDKPSRWT